MAYKYGKDKMSSGKMGMKGYNQGDMKPTVDNIQKPDKCYAESHMQKPTEYIARQDKRQAAEAKKLGGEYYMGKYS